MRGFLCDRRYWILPILFWGALAAVSLVWNRAEVDDHVDEMATNRARFIFKMVESIRLWNARHGGVYARVDENTPPNPHLEVPERDITSPSGKALTLVNPAYMTRQLADVVDELTDVRIHITSLKPINPHNAASPWEHDALTAFERDRELRELTEFTGVGDEKNFRYMAPLETKKACLQCHEKQGYRVGDIRGGISVSFSPGSLLAPLNDQYRNLTMIHLAVWLLLSALTWFFLQRFRNQMLELDAARGQQETLVEQRTAELRREMKEHQRVETQLQLFIDSSGEGIFTLDVQGCFMLCNPAALRMLGYEHEQELLGRPVQALICLYNGKGRQGCEGCERCVVEDALRDGEPGHVEEAFFRRKDGSILPVELRSSPLLADGRVTGVIITFADISERREREERLRKLSKAVEYSPVAAFITDAEGRIEYVNRKLLERTGYREQELIGETPSRFKSGQTPAETYTAMWDSIKQGRHWHGELLNRTKSGELFWEQTSIAPITDERGDIVNFVAFKEDITRRKAEEEAIWQQANFDALTGLPNRRYFHEYLNGYIRDAGRYERRFALLFIDLDGFKAINDSLGHDAGDEMLREAAQRLREQVRESDTVSRLGGDEFTVSLPDLQQFEDVGVVAEKLIARLAEPFTVKGREISVTASIGVAFYPADGESCEVLLKSADAAMYQAKKSGKNRYAALAEEASRAV